MRKSFLASPLILIGLFVLSGCSFSLNTAAPTPIPVTIAAQPVVLTPIIQVVTSTPRPTVTPVPVPTLPYKLEDYTGGWLMQINYQIYNGAYWSDIRYNGGVSLNVSAVGEIQGATTLYPSLQQPPCPAFVNGSTGLPMRVEGKLDALANGTVVARLQIIPQTPNAVQDFVLACADNDHAIASRFGLLWPALEATDQLNLTIPFAPASVYTSLRNLTLASGGRLNGTITTEIRLNR
jgi:hypothetical protein